MTTPLPQDHSPTSLASDNYAGVHPDVLTAIAEANGGHQRAYGADEHTAHLQARVRETFGRQAEAFCVFNGTGANVLSLAAVLPRWGAVVTARSAHVHNDEGGAPERMAGIKLLTVEAEDGRLTPELISQEAWGWGDEHRAQPLAVSITQSTELGTVYSPQELRAVADHAHQHDMALHLDGSRLWNAAASLDVGLAELTTEVGVDVVSLGGTKIGAMGVEAVVVLDASRAPGVHYLRKSTMQLASKMRFLSAQLTALLEDDLGLRNAAHANAMATRLRRSLTDVEGVTFTQPTQANAVFARLPGGVADRLREHVAFYDWDRTTGEVRWMTAWDTDAADVDAFAEAVRREVAAVRT